MKEFVFVVLSIGLLCLIIIGVLMLISQKAEQGFIDRSGKVVIKQQFDQAYDFSEGLAAVNIKGKWGYIDNSGAVVIPPKFEQADSFSDGLAAVQVDREAWGYIDKSGTMKITPRYTVAGRFQDGLTPAVTVEANAEALKHSNDDNDSQDCTLIDKTGKIVSTLKGCWVESAGRPFLTAVRFSERLLPVTSSETGMMGFMGEDGTLEIKAKFDDVRAFADGLAPARQNDRWGYIDKSGEWVIQPQFQDGQPFSDGVAAVGANAKWHFIDRNGKQLFVGEFDTAEPFSDGVANVRAGQRSGLIDKTGHFVLDNINCGGLHGGLAVYPSNTWADQVGLTSVRGNIIYAVKDIAKGQTITVDDVESHVVKANTIPDNAAISIKSLVGTKALRRIQANDIVSW